VAGVQDYPGLIVCLSELRFHQSSEHFVVVDHESFGLGVAQHEKRRLTGGRGRGAADAPLDPVTPAASLRTPDDGRSRSRNEAVSGFENLAAAVHLTDQELEAQQCEARARDGGEKRGYAAHGSIGTGQGETLLLGVKAAGRYHGVDGVEPIR
jgi:hypothetical protein